MVTPAADAAAVARLPPASLTFPGQDAFASAASRYLTAPPHPQLSLLLPPPAPIVSLFSPPVAPTPAAPASAPAVPALLPRDLGRKKEMLLSPSTTPSSCLHLPQLSCPCPSRERCWSWVMTAARVPSCLSPSSCSNSACWDESPRAPVPSTPR